jgi:hypothetical protein
MDLALAIEAIYPAAEYFGVTNENTKEQFDALDWRDERTKPTWKAIEAAWDAIPTQAEVEAEKEASKAALLERLGITADEAKLLLS